MACQYTGALTSSIFATYAGPSLGADFRNVGNPKFGDELLYLSVNPTLIGSLTASLALNTTYVLQAQFENPVSLDGCLWSQPLT